MNFRRNGKLKAGKEFHRILVEWKEQTPNRSMSGWQIYYRWDDEASL